MPIKLSYKKRLFLYFFLLFLVFTAVIVIIQQQNEKRNRIGYIEKTLANYVDITQNYINFYKLDTSTFYYLEKLDLFVLDNVRITAISEDGKVLYDKDIHNYNEVESHLNRPEIQYALSDSHGIHIRKSATTNEDYIYYAKNLGNYFIRVALPYDVDTQNLLVTGRHFIYIILALFIIVIIFINYVAERFGKSIFQLKNFTTQVKNNILPEDMEFPKDELGEIGKEIKEIFWQKDKSNKQIEHEREKLIMHFQYAEEGIGIFTPSFESIYCNSHFTYYLSMLSDNTQTDDNKMFDIEAFASAKNFITNTERKKNRFEYKFQKEDKIYIIQALIFEDNIFEITIKDVTEAEQSQLLKQQMTSNIAHELKTPVTTIYAYLESLQDDKFPPEVQKQFIERAFLQSERLTELIDDISFMSKIEEAPTLFPLEETNVTKVINGIVFDLTSKLEKQNIKVFISVEPDIIINSNHSLLYSIFRNLMDNTIKYAGDDIEIHIYHYHEDDDFLYFSYYDTGKGVNKEHLSRLFERFYRIDAGRTRATGGSGLGLAIVKNAVLFHKGKIEAKTHVKGGLQFLFTLRKDLI